MKTRNVLGDVQSVGLYENVTTLSYGTTTEVEEENVISVNYTTDA